MAVPVWSVGQVLTASDVNTWFVPITAYKGADQQNSGNVLINDNALSVSLAANAEYRATVDLWCTGNATIGSGDIKIAYTWPSGATVYWWGVGFAAQAGALTAGAVHYENTSGASHPFGLDSTGPVKVSASVATSSTSGSLTQQFAQNTSNGTVTKVLAGSIMTLVRIG